MTLNTLLVVLNSLVMSFKPESSSKLIKTKNK